MARKFHNTAKAGALVLVMTMTCGCENPYVVQLKNEFGWTEARMLRDGWLKSYPIAEAPVYCYRTLADADCFAKPQAGQKDRQISPAYEGDL